MEPLAFLLSHRGAALDLYLWPDIAIATSPRMVGLFAALFWTTVVLLPRRPLPPGWPYVTLVGYAIGSTAAFAGFARFSDWDVRPAVSYITALVAGAGMTAYLLAPLGGFFTRPHAVPRRTGGFVLVGIPLALSPFVFLGDHMFAGIFLVASACLGLLISLFLLNLGFLGSFVPPRSALIAATAYVLPEYLYIAMLPVILRWLLP